jgi:hypothetical protein
LPGRNESMAADQSRRDLLKLGLAAIPVGHFGFSQPTANAQDPAPQAVVPDLFPTQPPELAREMVTVAHFDLKRVKELVEARPSLARASWDWGSAIGRMHLAVRRTWATGRLPSI